MIEDKLHQIASQGAESSAGPIWLQWAAYSGFAAIAGMLGYIMRRMDAGERVTFWPVVVQGAGAAVVGLLAMWICQAAGLSQQWTAVTVGVSGWLGAQASIQVIQRMVYSKVGINRSQGNDDPK